MGSISHMVLVLDYGQKHMGSEALAKCDKAIESLPEDQLVLTNCGKGYGLMGRRQQALAVKTRVEGLSARLYVGPFGIALIADTLGYNDTAPWCAA